MKDDDSKISHYCKEIGVEPRRPLSFMNDYERVELKEQIRIRELELGLTPEEILPKKRVWKEVSNFEIFIVALAMGLIVGIMIGSLIWQR